MTPEEMFARFFGGGGGFGGPFGGGGFDAGPQFVFNFGGGPGVRVHQFGGARPRRRPRDPNQPEPEPTLASTIMGFLPIILILIFPILSFLFGGEASTPAVPHMSYEFPQPPTYMSERHMPNIPVNYYIDPNDVASWNSYKLKQLDKRAEANFLTKLKYDCENEHALKQRLEQEARGWFRPDPAKMEMAAKLELPACNRLRQFGVIF